MKKFISDYLKIIAITATGLVFLLSGFYLLLNYYHSEELKKDVYLNSKNEDYLAYRETINQLNVALRNNKSNNTLKSALTTCYNYLQKEGTLYALNTNIYYNAYDVYNLGVSFQTNLYNNCYTNNLSTFEDDVNILKTSVEAINDKVNFAIEELKGNGSYFFNTNISSLTVRNNLRSDFDMITSSYVDFANLLLNLANNTNSSENLINGGIND